MSKPAFSTEPAFLPNELEFLRQAEKAWRTIKSDDTWKAWWKIGAGLLIIRNGIMRSLHINEPKGKNYSRAFSEILDYHFPGLAATKQASYVLWIRSDPEREQICELLRDEMTSAQRSRVTDPNSMYKRVKAFIREREGVKPKREQTPNERIRELETLNAALQEQLAGNDFDGGAVVAHFFEINSVDGMARLLITKDRAKARELAEELIRRDDEEDLVWEPKEEKT